MLDSEDVGTLLSLFNEKVLAPVDDYVDEMVKVHLADEEDGLEEDETVIEETFEELSSSEQKATEKQFRKLLATMEAGLEEVKEELKGIDEEMLGDDDEDDEDDPEEDD
jgi:hypothetical protein